MFCCRSIPRRSPGVSAEPRESSQGARSRLGVPPAHPPPQPISCQEVLCPAVSRLQPDTVYCSSSNYWESSDGSWQSSGSYQTSEEKNVLDFDCIKRVREEEEDDKSVFTQIRQWICHHHTAQISHQPRGNTYIIVSTIILTSGKSFSLPLE